VFEIIAETRKIRSRASVAGGSEIIESANRIEQHADGMVKTILGTADLSTLEVPDSVIEEIVELLRAFSQLSSTH
jgi:4-hydroxy-3-methylbut-2-enyl diphosphate reductase IspH